MAGVIFSGSGSGVGFGLGLTQEGNTSHARSAAVSVFISGLFIMSAVVYKYTHFPAQKLAFRDEKEGDRAVALPMYFRVWITRCGT